MLPVRRMARRTTNDKDDNMKTRVCVHLCVLGNPNTQLLLWCGRLLAGIGGDQGDVETQLLPTTVGKLCEMGVLDGETRVGMADDREAWLYDDTNGGDGVVAVLVEANLG